MARKHVAIIGAGPGGLTAARNKFEEVNHCYLVGGGTHPGSGLPTIYESARISANLIDKYEK